MTTALLAFRPRRDPNYAALKRFRPIQACLVLATFMVVWLVAAPAFAQSANASANASSAVGYTAVFNASFAPTPPAPPAARTDFDGKAPLCDRRGAITFASAPQMQDVEVSVDTSLTREECLGDGSPSARDGRHRAAPSRGPLRSDGNDASSASHAAMLASAVTLAAIARELTPAPGTSTPCSRPGFRSTVDRPPRV